jgi:hypothetical protein
MEKEPNSGELHGLYSQLEGQKHINTRNRRGKRLEAMSRGSALRLFLECLANLDTVSNVVMDGCIHVHTS